VSFPARNDRVSAIRKIDAGKPGDGQIGSSQWFPDMNFCVIFLTFFRFIFGSIFPQGPILTGFIDGFIQLFSRVFSDLFSDYF
jgi:hypothetical protein